MRARKVRLVVLTGAVRLTSFAQPEADQFRAEVRAWLSQALPGNWRESEVSMTEDEQHEVRRRWDRQLFEAGYAGLAWPKEFGGQDAGPIADVILHEEIANFHAPEGLGRVGRVMAGPLLMLFGSDDQRQRYLPGILCGTDIWCLGLSEPQAGSDLAAIATSALRDGDGYWISGRKTWTSHAHYSRYCLLLARTSPDAPRGQNLSYFVVDLNQSTIQISQILTASGDHHFNEVTFDRAWVRVSDRIGPENDGWKLFRRSLSFERGASTTLNHYIEMRRECEVVSSCCGPAEGSASVAQAIRAFCNEVELVRWHVLRATELEAGRTGSDPATMVLKVWWSELWQRITDLGFRLECPDHRAYWQYQYLQSRAATIYAGTSEIQRNAIARRVLRDQPRPAD